MKWIYYRSEYIINSKGDRGTVWKNENNYFYVIRWQYDNNDKYSFKYFKIKEENLGETIDNPQAEEIFNMVDSQWEIEFLVLFEPMCNNRSLFEDFIELNNLTKEELINEMAKKDFDYNELDTLARM